MNIDADIDYLARLLALGIVCCECPTCRLTPREVAVADLRATKTEKEEQQCHS